MIDIGTELREALREEAARARQELLRPLTVPSPRAGWSLPGPRTGMAKNWLVPAAAALAVVAVITSVMVVGGQMARTHPGAVTPAASGAAGGRAADRGMPPYYVELSNSSSPEAAVIHKSATGRVTGRVNLPGGVWGQIAGAGNGLTYVLSRGSGGGGPAGEIRFYRLRVAPDGRSARLAKLPIPPLRGSGVVDGLALTADGSRLAIAIQLGGSVNYGEVEVASTSTGAVRMWKAAQAGVPWQVSWVRGGRLLGFYWAGKPAASGLWLLDTRARGGNLLAARHVPGTRRTDAAVISPDGRTVIAAVNFRHKPPLHKSTVVAGMAEMSAKTGRVLQLIHTQTAVPWGGPGKGWASSGCDILAAAPVGQHLLVTCGGFGRIDNGYLARLPGPSDTALTVAW